MPARRIARGVHRAPARPALTTTSPVGRARRHRGSHSSLRSLVYMPLLKGTLQPRAERYGLSLYIITRVAPHCVNTLSLSLSLSLRVAYRSVTLTVSSKAVLILAFGTTTRDYSVIALTARLRLVRARVTVTCQSYSARAQDRRGVCGGARARTSRARVRASSVDRVRVRRAAQPQSSAVSTQRCATRTKYFTVYERYTVYKSKRQAQGARAKASIHRAQEPSSGAKPSITDFYLRMRITQIIPLLDHTQQTTPVANRSL